MSATDARDFNVRGYMILNAAAYLRETLGEKESGRLFEQVSPETRAIVASATSAGWYPVSAISEVFGLVASLGNGNEERAKQALFSCGGYIAREATNTFLRLLMRMLTPNLFAKKLPDFWKRDATRGRLEVEVTDQKLVCRHFDMPGFNHVVCTSVGYATFALEAMGKSVESVAVYDWSLANPNVDGARMELVWKK